MHLLKKLASGAVVYGLGGVLARTIPFFTLPLFTAYLAPVDYGTTAMLALLGVFLVGAFSLGAPSVIGLLYYFESEDAARRTRVIQAAFALLLASCGLMPGVGLPLADWLGWQLLHVGGQAYLVAVSLVGTALGVLALPFSQRLQFDQRPRALRRTAEHGHDRHHGGRERGAGGGPGPRRQGMIEGNALGQLVLFLTSMALAGAWLAAALGHGHGPRAGRGRAAAGARRGLLSKPN